MRNTLGKNKAQALEESQVRGDLYGEQLKAADLANRQNAYALREQVRKDQLQRAHIGQYNLSAKQCRSIVEIMSSCR